MMNHKIKNQALIFLSLLFIIPVQAIEACPGAQEIENIVREVSDFLPTGFSPLHLPLQIKYTPLKPEIEIDGFADSSYENLLEVKMTGQRCAKPMSRAGLYFLICHELGHFYGGVPYSEALSRNKSQTQISAEGQADYYATSVCLPKLYQANILKISEADRKSSESFNLAIEHCKNLNAKLDVKSKELCEIAVAGSFEWIRHIHKLQLDDVNNTRKHPGPEPRLEFITIYDQDRFVKTTITNDYPKIQCRLETMLAGFNLYLKNIFKVDFNENFYLRPKCWFAASITRT